MLTGLLGSPLPVGSLVVGRGIALGVRLSGLVARRFVRRVAVLLMFITLGGVSFCIATLRVAPLLDLRRRIKAVFGYILDAMIRNGVSLSRSVEAYGSTGLCSQSGACFYLHLLRIFSLYRVLTLANFFAWSGDMHSRRL